jgi:glycosyltransferase involved in cell wall biosynthesis
MNPGSMEGIIEGISNYLITQNIRPIILNYTANNHFNKYARVINVKWGIPSGKMVGEAISRKLMIFDVLIRLFLLSRKVKLDVIHCFFAFPAGVSAVLFKFFNKETKVVITVAGDDVEFLAPINYGLRLNVIENHLIRYCLRNADRVIAPSHFSANLSIIAGSNNNKTVLIPFGIDLIKIDKFVDESKFNSPRREHKLNDNYVLITLCRLHPKKGLTYLIDGVNKVLKKIENVRLVIVGDGSERAFLEKKVLDLGLNDKVIFTGYIPNNEKYNLMSMSDIFILPSLSDTFPITVLEAMGCNLPVIVTDNVGVSDYIHDNDCGYVIPIRNSNKISECVLYLLQDKKHLIKQSINARKVSTMLNYDNVGRQILVQYRILLS